MRKFNKSKIKRLFLRCKDYEQLEQKLNSWGFEVNMDGMNKFVFIHPKWHWVVKMVYGFDYKPKKETVISKFYLHPEEAATRTFEDKGRIVLTFQPKVEQVNSIDLYRKLLDLIRKAGTCWSGDDHEGNCGLYKGRIVIIDY